MRSLSKSIFLTMCLLALQVFMGPAIWDVSGMVSGAAAAPLDDDWLEPRGLNVIDLVGEIPEDSLKDAIVSFVGGDGISQYESGVRNGDVVTVTYRVTPNYRSDPTPVTQMSCPSYQGFSDHWPVPMPEARAHFYAGHEVITHLIYALQYHPSGLFKPSFGATTDRYPRVTAQSFSFSDDGAIEVPANMGCTLFFLGIHDDVRAIYTYEQPKQVRVRLLGSDVFDFQSYIGPGEAGWLTALQEQMSQFGNRHDKFFLQPPPGTDYVFVNYPPTPVGAYVSGDIETNIRLPSSGTYRLASGEVKLSTDHYVSFAMPLQGQWQDADLAGYLYLSRLTNVNVLASPEYFVPVGVEYDPCMRFGGCSSQLLQRIYSATMQLTVNYLSVERIVPGLQRIPLRQVGPGWVADTQALADTASTYELAPSTLDLPPFRLHLPVIGRKDALLPDDPTGCPCGWFDSSGRMLAFIPRLEQ